MDDLNLILLDFPSAFSKVYKLYGQYCIMLIAICHKCRVRGTKHDVCMHHICKSFYDFFHASFKSALAQALWLWPRTMDTQ